MPTPLVVQIMQAHKQSLAQQDAAQMRAMAQRWLQMETELQDQVELFARRVAMDGLTVGQLQSRQFQLDRYRSLLEQVRGQLDKYTAYAGDLITERQGVVGRAGIKIAEQAINAVASERGVKIAFDRLPVEAVQNMVGLAGNGSPLRALLAESFGVGADGMLNELIRATTLGKNPRETARTMLRNGLGQSLSRMMTIARTESLRVGREATRQGYQASGVVEAYRRLATKDRSACIACIMADGETYELTETLREHPNGRCTTIPVVTGLPLVEWEKGRDWLAKASPDTQRAVMGKGRFAAWQDGRFDLDQLISVRSNSVWGDSLQPTTLADLLGGTARPYTVRQPDLARFVRDLAEPEPEIAEPEPLLVEEIPESVTWTQQVARPASAPIYAPGEAQIRSATQLVNIRIKQIAQENGTTPEDVEQAIQTALDNLLERSELHIKFKSKYFDALLEDGRLKTQFETGASGGTLDTAIRTKGENMGMGIPNDIDPRLRPIYGYVNADPDAFIQTAQYGNLSFVLKPEVRKRASFTVGDSLQPFIEMDVAASPLTAPSKEAWDNRVKALYKFAKTGNTNDLVNEVSYLEVQIQNGASLNDVSAIIDRVGKLTKAQKDQLIDWGIEVRRE